MQNLVINWMVQYQIDHLQVLNQFHITLAGFEAFTNHRYDFMGDLCGYEREQGLFYPAYSQFSDVPEVNPDLLIESVGLHLLVVF